MRNTAPVFIERRSEPRTPVNLPARLYYGQNLAMWADCQLKDLSQSGAKVQLSSIYVVPPRLMLVHLQDGIAYDAVVRWRRGDLAGLSFEHAQPLATNTEPRLAAIREAWIALQPGIGPRDPGLIG